MSSEMLAQNSEVKYLGKGEDRETWRTACQLHVGMCLPTVGMKIILSSYKLKKTQIMTCCHDNHVLPQHACAMTYIVIKTTHQSQQLRDSSSSGGGPSVTSHSNGGRCTGRRQADLITTINI